MLRRLLDSGWDSRVYDALTGLLTVRTAAQGTGPGSDKSSSGNSGSLALVAAAQPVAGGGAATQPTHLVCSASLCCAQHSPPPSPLMSLSMACGSIMPCQCLASCTALRCLLLSSTALPCPLLLLAAVVTGQAARFGA